jgi:hypothetical protein
MKMEPSMVLIGMEVQQSIFLERHKRISKFMFVILITYCLEKSALTGYYFEPR